MEDGALRPSPPPEPPWTASRTRPTSPTSSGPSSPRCCLSRAHGAPADRRPPPRPRRHLRAGVRPPPGQERLRLGRPPARPPQRLDRLRRTHGRACLRAVARRRHAGGDLRGSPPALAEGVGPRRGPLGRGRRQPERPGRAGVGRAGQGPEQEGRRAQGAGRTPARTCASTPRACRCRSPSRWPRPTTRQRRTGSSTRRPSGAPVWRRCGPTGPKGPFAPVPRRCADVGVGDVGKVVPRDHGARPGVAVAERLLGLGIRAIELHDVGPRSLSAARMRPGRTKRRYGTANGMIGLRTVYVAQRSPRSTPSALPGTTRTWVCSVWSKT